MSNILVTGGAGFIGSHLVDRLISDGNKVVSVDNKSAVSNHIFFENRKAENLCFDICSSEYLNLIFEKYKFDYVYHLAAQSRIQISLHDPLKTSRTNYIGTHNLLELSKKYSVKNFIFSSTSSIYGKTQTAGPLHETNRSDCLTPYSVSKLACENLCKVYAQLGLPTVSLRYFNVYGDRQPLRGEYATVIGLFLKQRAEGENLTVVGDGKQTRDFTHVSDIINANIAAKNCPEDYRGAVFNIGYGKSYPIIEVAKTISDKILHIPMRFGEARHTLADISLAKKVLAYKPETNLMDYLEKK